MKLCHLWREYLTVFGSPTVFAFAGQLLGLGNTAPIFYFLCITFGPSASDLRRSPSKRKLIPEESAALLPLLLVLHTFEVFKAYLALEPTTRHYWTWAWQMTPVWVGIVNFVLAETLGRTSLRATKHGPPKVLLGTMCLVSSGVWLYTLTHCGYSLSTIFLPEKAAQHDFVGHMRRALQFDEISVFTSSFLWLAYLLWDVNSAGLVGDDWTIKAATLPFLIAAVGPGSAFALGWLWRENLLQSSVHG